MLRDSLRIHTRSHHERIEQALDLPGSVRSTEDLRRLLARFYGFYLPHETRLRSHTCALDAYGIELRERLKSKSIRNDLRRLGMSARAIGTLPMCAALPDLRTPAHALGSIYVLEGSTLGSQVIERALSERIDANLMATMQFLSGYGADTGRMWRAFVSALDAVGLEPEGVAAAQEGAVDTFQSLECWMFGFARQNVPESASFSSASPS